MSRKFLTPIVLPGDPVAAMEAATKQYVDAAATGNEVFIGPTDPGAAYELWVDDDAPFSYPVPAGMPRGWVAMGVGTASNVTGIGATPTVIAGLSATWIAEPSRRYKTTLEVVLGEVTALCSAGIFNGADSAQLKQHHFQLTAGGYGSLCIFIVETGLSGNTTRLGQVWFSAGTGSYIGNIGRHGVILVEDIGGT